MFDVNSLRKDGVSVYLLSKAAQSAKIALNCSEGSGLPKAAQLLAVLPAFNHQLRPRKTSRYEVRPSG